MQLHWIERRNPRLARHRDALFDHIVRHTLGGVEHRRRLMHRADEAPRSFTVWTAGVDTLLPPAELIALVQPDGNNAKHVLVAWEDALTIAGDLLEPSDLVPIRYRARRFPCPQVLERLMERAVM